MLGRSLLLALLCWRICRAADYRVEANVRYSRYAETVLDIFQPRSPALKDRPAAIVIHGGGWVSGAKEDVVQVLCAPLVERGFVVANVDYRLAAAAPAPAAVNDIFEAAAWLAQRSAGYRIDPKRIITIGHSAGGELALMAALAPESAGFGPATKIAAVVNISGVADVAGQIERDYVATWLGAAADRMDLARRLSPLTYVRKGAPPVLTIHGDADASVPYEQAVRLTSALKQAGSDAELITVKGAGHEFGRDQVNWLWPQIFKWLKKRKIE
jgi:acetyl esterase/lipase